MIWLDAYERRARLVPGLLALLPIAIVAIALGIDDAPVASSAVSLLSVTGGPVLLADVVRSWGLGVEARPYRVGVDRPPRNYCDSGPMR